MRLTVGALGVALGVYGAVLALTRQDPVQLVEVAVWLGAGVALHDGVIAGVAIVLAVLARRVLPRPWLAPATLALVVWGSVSVMAIPVLGRFGARPDNATLLDRPYLVSWSLLTLATVAAVGVAGAVRARRTGG
ncbi:hypothetical protein [Nocardioides currus]|uniref:hypothetical protein n=1 Tax=Nocardioides currus TaxID=2133958 RepID=UPI0010570037|nr:hypothetical protein [Nocardioides currus]